MSSTEKPSLLSAVWIPAAQAIITGGLLGIAAGTLANLAEWGDPLTWSLAAWVIGTLGAWLIYRSEWLQRIRPHPLPAPAPQEVTTTRIELVTKDPAGAYLIGVWAEFDISPERIRRAARRVLAGAGFSHAGVAGAHRPLTRAEFETLRDEFIRRGLAAWTNPEAHSRGVQLTAAGRAVIKRLAALQDETAQQPGTMPHETHAHINTWGGNHHV
jgi:hypothetical protein